MLLLIAWVLAADPHEERRFANTGSTLLPSAWRDPGFELAGSGGGALLLERCGALDPECELLNLLFGGAGRLSWSGNGSSTGGGFSIDPGIDTSAYSFDLHAGYGNAGPGLWVSGGGGGRIGEHLALGIWGGLLSATAPGQVFLFGAALNAGGPKAALDLSMGLFAKPLVNSAGLGVATPLMNEIGFSYRFAPMHTVRIGTVLSLPGLDWALRCATGVEPGRGRSNTPACGVDGLANAPAGELFLRFGVHSLGVASLVRAEFGGGW